MKSYVTLLSNDSYTYGIMLLVESLHRVRSKYPLHVLITEDVSAASIEILDQLNVTHQLVGKIAMPKAIYNHNKNSDARLALLWKYTWTKFKAFDLTQFDKIIFLDADLLFLKNIDHLFNCPHLTAALDGEYFNMWKDNPHFNNGCVVIEPSHELFLDLINFVNNLDVNQFPEYIMADQEVINLYFKDWVNQKELHLNKYYNVFTPYIQEKDVEDIKQNAYFVHFVGRNPWDFYIRGATETYSEYFYELAMNYMQKIENQLDYKKIQSKLKLSIYAICKNEIKFIDNWLKCFSKADYVCILDTGSTDGTWEFLQKQTKIYPNLIIDQQIITPWRFDTARNKSLELIPKDTTIYFMMDLDELIKEDDWITEIKSQWRPNFTRGEYNYNRDVSGNDVIDRCYKEYRIHSKKWCKYINIVHEALCDERGEKRFYTAECTPMNITVWHYPQTEKDRTYYLELCEKALEELPDDGIMYLQLILEYEIIQNYDKILEYSFKVIKNEDNLKLQPFEKARVYTSIGRVYAQQNKIDQALWYFSQGRLIAPDFFDNYIEPAYIFLDYNDYQKAIDILKAALAACPCAYHCNLYDIKSYVPYYLIGLAYLNQNKFFESLSYLEIAYYLNNDPEIRKILNDIINDIIQHRTQIFK